MSSWPPLAMVVSRQTAGRRSSTARRGTELAGAIGTEQLAGQLVLAAVAGRVEASDWIDILEVAATGLRVAVEARVHPRPGPDVARVDVVVVRRAGVGIRDRECLLVADEGAIRRRAAVDARFPAGLPINFVAAHEDEIDAGRARCLHIGARRGVPIFVMPGGGKRLVVLEVVGSRRSVSATDVGDVIPASRASRSPHSRAEQIVLRSRAGRCPSVMKMDS